MDQGGVMDIDEALLLQTVWRTMDSTSSESIVLRTIADEYRNLRRGEFICRQCGLREDGQHGEDAGF